MNPDEPIDFSALDPTADEHGFEERLAWIRAGVAPTLAKHRARVSLWAGVATWTRPALAAAALMLLVALSAFTLVDVSGKESSVPAGIAEAIGIPASLSTWLRPDNPMSVKDILELEDLQ
jgi:hypothetical protein